MTDPEDETISSLRCLSNSELDHSFIRAIIRDKHEALAGRAFSLYSLAFQSIGRQAINRQSFVDQYLYSWEEFYVRAAGLEQQVLSPDTDLLHGCVYATWHFPEYPAFLSFMASTDAYILVAREVEWMTKLVPRSRLINFKSNEVRRLGHVMHRRLPVLFMHDYCYKGTRSIESNFLGFQCRSPIGLLRLSHKLGYKCGFISSTGNGLSVSPVDTLKTRSEDVVVDLVDRLNQFVEAEILQSPCRWLLWPSFDSRWSI